MQHAPAMRRRILLRLGVAPGERSPRRVVGREDVLASTGMIARLQRYTTCLLLLGVLAWVAAWLWLGRPGVAVAGALLLLFSHALVMAVEFVAASLANRADPAPRARWPDLLRAWWGEVTTTPAIFCWRQPFRAGAVPDDPGRPGQRGLVLVHGFLCNRGFWTPWLRRLRARGIPFVAVTLEPAFGRIDAYAEVIEAAVQKLEAATGQAPVLVGHSMGGLAIRVWLRDHPSDERVHRVITIGSPHRGTLLGRFGRTPNARQMMPDSEWLQALARQEPPGRYGRFTCFYSHTDNIVLPASTATLPGADNRHLPGTAHVHMAFHEAVFQEALAWIARADSSSDAASPVLAASQPAP